MFTLFCYLFALVPVVAILALWLFNKKIVLWEAIVVVALSFITVAIFNWLAIKGMTDDTETWSGCVVSAIYQPAWVEYYEYEVYRTETYTDTEYYTDSKGKSQSRTVTKTRRVFDHWQPSFHNHDQEWHATDTLASPYSISQDRYDDIKTKFGGTTSAANGCRTTGRHNSRMLSGDPYDYIVNNNTNHVYPVTTTKTWENKVLGSPSLFSFHKVAPGVPVNEYPINNDRFTSSRLFGTANAISIYKWDQFNADLGPKHKVNVIACGFKDLDMSIAMEQEAKWIGGKKNDLVICFGGEAVSPTWVYVFGWTEQDFVKKNLQLYIMDHGLTNDNLNNINDIISKDYFIKDWSKFDYLTVEVPFSKYIWLIVTNIIVCGAWIVFILFNDINKNNGSADGNKYKYSYNGKSYFH